MMLAPQWGRLQSGHRTPLPLVRTFDLAPFQGALLLVNDSPGLKPWAEFSSPFGAQNKASDAAAPV